jgi:hypothetical protein
MKWPMATRHRKRQKKGGFQEIKMLNFLYERINRTGTPATAGTIAFVGTPAIQELVKK